LSTTEVGVWGLWIAALLTLLTGYDYLRAGLHHVDRLDSEHARERAATSRTPAATDAR
jgi:hypothetical protein